MRLLWGILMKTKNNNNNTENCEQKFESIFEAAIEQRLVRIENRLMSLLPTKSSDLSTDKPLKIIL